MVSEHNYDAVLILSFGGPEKPEDVIPFLENVLRGRNVPRERMLEVAEHYYHFGGKSPINDQNRALIAGLESGLASEGTADAGLLGQSKLASLPGRYSASDAHRRRPPGAGLRHLGLQFVFRLPAIFGRYRSGPVEAGEGAPEIDKLRSFYNHPLFIEAEVDRVRAALDEIPADARANARIIYTAHSVPVAMAETSDYQKQLNESCRLVSESLGLGAWQLVYQSRSGPPGQPWLEPDIGDVLRGLEPGASVVIVPIGFISDHMEVLYDLDTEARAIARERGLRMVRAATVGVHPKFLLMIRELILEKLVQVEPRAIGRYGPSQDTCRADCCPAPARRPTPAIAR